MNQNSINKLSFFDNYELLNTESIVLDIGANTGEVTDYIFRKYKCNIYAYEPNPVCYNHMKNKYSKIDKIIINNCAISNFNGNDFLYFHYDAKGNNDIRYIQGATLRKEKDNIDINKKIKVKIQNIKDILSSFNNIDLIKIDIEGSEYNILPELIKNKNKIGIVLCEMHGNPNGKKINGKHKNKNFTGEYKTIVLKLKRLGLYNNWFYEWH
mgnify:FL=1